MGLRAAARTQLNLAVTKNEDIESAKGLRDIILPLLWFSEGIDSLDDPQILQQLKLAVVTPEVVREAMWVSCWTVVTVDTG